jgi:hypothetical protein
MHFSRGMGEVMMMGPRQVAQGSLFYEVSTRQTGGVLTQPRP